MNAASLDLLKKLTGAKGVSGDEREVRTIFLDELKEKSEVIRDRMGSVVFRREGTAAAPKVMLDAHIDEIGFMVRSVTSRGYLKFVTIGGWWSHIIPGTRVNVLTPKGVQPGVIGSKSPHLLSPAERKNILDVGDMAVDIGASTREEALAMGAAPGQWVVPDSDLFTLNDGKILAGKAFDDRAGCALLIEAMKDLDGFPCTLFGSGTVQEEVGLRGARTVTDVIDPDVAIILEGAPAADTYGGDIEDRQGILGDGVQIRLFDPTMIANPGLARFMIDTAEAEGIPYQLLVRDKGGTDAGQIHLHGRGVPAVVLAVSVRYAHSPIGMIHADDYDAALRLVKAAVMGLDEETVASFV